MFRRQSVGAGNPECAAGGDAIVASARLVVGKVMKGVLSVRLTCLVPEYVLVTATEEALTTRQGIDNQLTSIHISPLLAASNLRAL